VFPALVIVLAFVLIVYLQNDFSSALYLFLLSLLLFFVAGTPILHFAYIGLLVLSPAAVLLFTKEHRVRRLLAFLNPAADPSGTGYQAAASVAALSNGGFWGLGLGEGVRKTGLPEAHADYILAVLGEEAGFLGILFVLVLFGGFAVRGYMISAKAPDQFRSLAAFGMTTAVCFQALMHIAVVGGVLPPTGMPLPFFSAGGTAVLSTMIICGVLLNISRAAGRERS
jgi:cell division protein FtsW